MMVQTRPRVVLADDHVEVFAALRQLLEPHFNVVATAEDGASVLKIAKLENPDLIVLDISMPKLGGIEAAKRLRKTDPQTRIVFLTMHQDLVLAKQALAAGALGYVWKMSAATDLVKALKRALQGRRFISPSLEKRNR